MYVAYIPGPCTGGYVFSYRGRRYFDVPHIQQLAMNKYGDEHLAEAAVALAEHHGTRQDIETGKSVLPDLQDLAVHILHQFPAFKEWLRHRGKEQQGQPAPEAQGERRPPDEF